MKVSSLILSVLFASTSYANCPDPVSYLRKGQISVCNGYLFSPEKEKEVRELTVKYPMVVELVEKQERLINVLNDRVDLNQNIANNLREQVKTVESNNRLENIVYFFLGMAVGFGINKVVN